MQADMDVIQSYAPADDKGELAKEGFYRKLQSTIGNLRNVITLISKSDLNAKIGLKSTGYETIMGTCEPEDME